MQQLLHRHPQDRAVERGHPLDAPLRPRRARAAGRSTGVLRRRPRPARGRTRDVPAGVEPAGQHRPRRRPGDVGLVQDVDRDPSGLSAARHLNPSHVRCTRPMRVSTLMRSPSSTNSGTWTTTPVSSVAGFMRARSACHPSLRGRSWTIAQHDRGRELDRDGHPLVHRDLRLARPRRGIGGVAHDLARHVHLVVRVHVHEHVVVAVGVQVLHRPCARRSRARPSRRR